MFSSRKERAQIVLVKSCPLQRPQSSKASGIESRWSCFHPAYHLANDFNQMRRFPGCLYIFMFFPFKFNCPFLGVKSLGKCIVQ